MYIYMYYIEKTEAGNRNMLSCALLLENYSDVTISLYLWSLRNEGMANLDQSNEKCCSLRWIANEWTRRIRLNIYEQP